MNHRVYTCYGYTILAVGGRLTASLAVKNFNVKVFFIFPYPSCMFLLVVRDILQWVIEFQ